MVELGSILGLILPISTTCNVKFVKQGKGVNTLHIYLTHPNRHMVWCMYKTLHNAYSYTYVQGRTKWRNCRLSIETPDYQFGWAVQDPLNATYIFCSDNSPNLTCYVTLRVHIINDLSTIPSLRSNEDYLLLQKVGCCTEITKPHEITQWKLLVHVNLK